MTSNRDLDIIERISQNLYHATSRRGFLSTLGKTLLGLAGVTVVDALPLDRTTKIAVAGPLANHTNPLSCQYWKYCSIFTGSWYPCQCCSQVNSDCLCPYGTSSGTNYWVGCCSSPSGIKTLLKYYDCSVSLPGQVQCTNTDCTIQCHNHNNANGVTEQQTHQSGPSGSYYHLSIWGPNSNVVCTTVCTISNGC